MYIIFIITEINCKLQTQNKISWTFFYSYEFDKNEEFEPKIDGCSHLKVNEKVTQLDITLTNSYGEGYKVINYQSPRLLILRNGFAKQ